MKARPTAEKRLGALPSVWLGSTGVQLGCHAASEIAIGEARHEEAKESKKEEGGM